MTYAPVMSRFASVKVALLCVLISVGGPSSASECGDPPAADLIHSDLPLYESSWADKWPQHFTDGATGDFGCTSRVRFGDWQLRYHDEAQDDAWFRFTNYGVFHCWANIYEGDERAGLEAAAFKRGFFVLLGSAGKDRELWAIQVGARPGSEYILLSRDSGPEKITKFDVLERDCPAAKVRDAGSLDSLATRYCSISSQSDLLALARRMERRKPVGTLMFSGAADHAVE